VHFFFADDAKQGKPTRERMGSLVAIGGIVVPGDRLQSLEQEISRACDAAGFPPGEEFKWSPRRDQWMYANLVEDARRDFFREVLRLAADHGAEALVVIDDTSYGKAISDAPNHETDVTRMFLERADNYLRWTRVNDHGVVIADRPGGGRLEEDKFLLDCLEMLQVGTKYVKPERIALPVLSVRSDLVRLAQLADVVTGCTLSRVAGEAQYAPPVFEGIKPLLLKTGGRVGGVGLKIHPDLIYVNLYHWVLGDDTFGEEVEVGHCPSLGIRTTRVPTATEEATA
jgi:hypothetical protein